jgi:GNAT superfamily N-acetyltransferase
MFHVEPISRTDMDVFIRILRRRIEWLAARSIRMWSLDQADADYLMKRYDDPACYVGFEDRQPVGGFLLLEQDSQYWPDNTGDAAFYFHKLVVDPEYRGRDYAGRLLEWIKRYAREKGKKYVRLDYDKTRAYLRKLYPHHGFRDVREADREDGYHLQLAEYEV